MKNRNQKNLINNLNYIIRIIIYIRILAVKIVKQVETRIKGAEYLKQLAGGLK